LLVNLDLSCVKDGRQNGRPNNSLTKHNVTAVKEMFEKATRYTVGDKSSKVGMSDYDFG
jgi:hypothetical protein